MIARLTLFSTEVTKSTAEMSRGACDHASPVSARLASNSRSSACSVGPAVVSIPNAAATSGAMSARHVARASRP